MRPKFWTQLETNTLILTVNENDYPLTFKQAKSLLKELKRELLRVNPPKHWRRPVSQTARPSPLRFPVGPYKEHLLPKVPAKYLLWFETTPWFKRKQDLVRYKQIADYINFYRSVLEAEANAHRRPKV